MMISTNTKLHVQWCVAAVTAAALGLVTGCASDAPVAPAEPDTGDASQAVTVSASADTTARLDIATWRYLPTSDGDGIVVRGLTAGTALDEVARVRFSISSGDTSDELVAYMTDTGAHVSISRAGGEVRGDDPELRDAVTAFLTDAEAAEVHDKKGTSQVNDNVSFCPGSSAAFGTWFFGPTRVQIANWSPVWTQFSLQSGPSAEETPWIQPWTAPTFERWYWGLTVRVSYINWSGGAPPCVNVYTW